MNCLLDTNIISELVGVKPNPVAATALHYDMALVTRNIKDFADYPGLELINPWG